MAPPRLGGGRTRTAGDRRARSIGSKRGRGPVCEARSGGESATEGHRLRIASRIAGGVMSIDRRRLLQHEGIVAGGAVSASWLARVLYDADGEEGKPKKHQLILPAQGFAVEKSTILPALGVATGTDPRKLVRAAVEAIGGMRRFIQTNDIV